MDFSSPRFMRQKHNLLAIDSICSGLRRHVGKIILPGILILFSMILPGRANAAEVTENQVKVAYLFNFAHFVEWPTTAFDSPDSPFHLCVLGVDPFAGTLATLEKRNHQGHAIIIDYPRSARKARSCHILYIAPSMAGRELKVISRLDDAPILTVSSLPGFVDQGGVIGFTREGNHVRFSINHAACKQAALQCSAKLLEVALRVVDEVSRKGRR